MVPDNTLHWTEPKRDSQTTWSSQDFTAQLRTRLARNSLYNELYKLQFTHVRNILQDICFFLFKQDINWTIWQYGG